MDKVRKILLTVLLIVSFSVLSVAQSGVTAYYLYDDNGRLKAVIYPTGNAGIYEYDAADNFTGIRTEEADMLEFISFDPRAGLPGIRVRLFGVGFNGVSSVLFNGVSANIISSTNNTIIAEVPVGATSGIITINTPLGTADSVRPFLVQRIMINPANAVVQEGLEQQFTA